MKRSTTKKKKKWIWLLAIVGVLLLGLVIYLSIFYHKLTETVETMHQPIPTSEKRQDVVTLEEKEPFSVLLLGVDEREGDKGRSDTMVVLTVNPADQSTKMLSIQRDTYTEIIGTGKSDKINHAYAIGGVEMSKDTVENLMDIPIDYVIQVNMEGFQDIVDAVGGITVNNSQSFKLGKYNFPTGKIELNGEESLAYVRMRKEDPRGDFGRQDRQKQVIQEIIKKGASVSSILNYGDIFKALGKNIRTNITFDEMVTIQSKYKDASKNVEQLYFKEGTGKITNGIWYYYPDEAELETLQDSLKTHLEINS